MSGLRLNINFPPELMRELQRLGEQARVLAEKVGEEMFYAGFREGVLLGLLGGLFLLLAWIKHHE